MRGSVIRNSPSYLPALYADGHVGASLLASLHNQEEIPVATPEQPGIAATEPARDPKPASEDRAA